MYFLFCVVDDVPEDWDKGAAIQSSDGATSQTTSKPQGIAVTSEICPLGVFVTRI